MSTSSKRRQDLGCDLPIETELPEMDDLQDITGHNQATTGVKLPEKGCEKANLEPIRTGDHSVGPSNGLADVLDLKSTEHVFSITGGLHVIQGETGENSPMQPLRALSDGLMQGREAPPAIVRPDQGHGKGLLESVDSTSLVIPPLPSNTQFTMETHNSHSWDPPDAHERNFGKTDGYESERSWSE